jgi:hypothetical protein
MTDTPITDAIALYPNPTISDELRSLAAAALTGPLVERVDCPTCGGDGEVAVTEDGFDWLKVCPDCEHGWVRLVVHVVTPDVAAAWQSLIQMGNTSWLPMTFDYKAVRTAAAILDPQDGDQ